MEKNIKNLLLITPKSFYLFHHYLSNAFEKKGYAVTIANDEYPENFIGKILGKFNFNLGRTITKKRICNEFLKDKRYDLILIIKGRGMSCELIDEMTKVSTRIVGYTFDSIKYHSAPLLWWEKVNSFYTFDYRDSKNYNMALLELFSSMSEGIQDILERDIDLSVICRNHSDRLVYLDNTLKLLPIKNLFIYIFEKDIATFIINFITNPFLYIKYRKFIHFKSLDYNVFCKIMQRSVFTLDYAHPEQSGLTMRSFEAAALGVKLITNNYHIYESFFKPESDAIVYSLNGDGEQLLKDYNKLILASTTSRVRSIHDFVDDILSQTNKNSILYK